MPVCGLNGESPVLFTEHGKLAAQASRNPLVGKSFFTEGFQSFMFDLWLSLRTPVFTVH